MYITILVVTFYSTYLFYFYIYFSKYENFVKMVYKFAFYKKIHFL